MPHPINPRAGAFPRILFPMILATALLPGPVRAQESGSPPPPSPGIRIEARILLTRAIVDSGWRLDHRFILEGSDSLAIVGVRALAPSEYRLDRRTGRLTLDSATLGPFALALPPETLLVIYRYLPITLRESYALRTLVASPDSAGRGDSLRLRRAVPALTMHEIFGPNLQKSGSLVRGFTVGSNRDLSLNSGLRLQLSGQLARDLDITAALTDENTPLQPEGTTQTLQEFDKVFVDLKGKNLSGTLGDFVLDLQKTEFGRLSRKLQGARATGEFTGDEARGSVTAAGAVTRGRFHTLQFNGIEGVQGPYRLVGKNNETGIIVIAGTERVYINGEKQTRGESNDYIIDYSTGEVTFGPRRLITSASRITIDFEYSDRQYSRSLLAAQGTSTFLSDRATLTLGYYREADNPDTPIDFQISDSLRHILERAGGDPNRAVVEGAVRVDSNGFYVRIDTLLLGQPSAIYRFAPGDPQADYVVSFSRVGSGNGDYTRRGIGEFVWAGKGGGEYLPLRFLPLPELQELANASLEVTPLKGVRLTGELAGSSTDANRFSTVPGNLRRGNAFTAGGSVVTGLLDLNLRARNVGAEFRPLDRTNEIEFNRRWGIDTVREGDESLLEGGVRVRPLESVAFTGNFGSFSHGGLKSTRWDAGATLAGEGLPSVTYGVERILAEEERAGLASSWLRHRGEASFRLGEFLPRVRYEGERKEYASLGSDAPRPGGFRFDDFGPGIRYQGGKGFSATAEWGWRNESSWLNGGIVPSSRAFTQTYAARYSGDETFMTSLDVATRSKIHTRDFLDAGNIDVRSLIVRNQTRIAPFRRAIESDLFYEVSTQRSSRLERLFVRVPVGTGSYRYLGDLNGNGLAEEAEFEQTRFDGEFIPVTVASDRLVPVVDVKASSRIRVIPSRFLSGTQGWLADALSSIVTETYLRVDEKSTDPEIGKIALLHFSRFRNDSTTMIGNAVFIQDLLILEGNAPFSARIRFQERNGLNNFSGGAERGRGSERSLRVKLQLLPGIAQQLDFARRTDRVSGNASSPRLRDILSDDLTFDLSYRPEQRFELGLKIGTTTSADRRPPIPLDCSLNSQSVRLSYAFAGTGQLRGEFTREEILLSRSGENVPFELTGGRVAGKSWIWKGGMEFRVTTFLEATATYDGRLEGGAPPVHTGRAELRAFF